MYSSLDDIKKQIPADAIIQLTDDEQVGITLEMIVAALAGTPDPELEPAVAAAAAAAASFITEAIENADVVIDGYCSARYQFPFAVVPPIIKPISVDLAIYNLYARRFEVMPELRDKNRSNAIKLLTDISLGKVKLGSLAATAAPVAQQSPQITSNPRLFGRNKMKGL